MNGDRPHHHEIGLDEAFDFLNTRELESGSPVEHLASLRDALDWLARRDLVHDWLLEQERARAEADPQAAERAVARIRRVRDALREVTYAVVERRGATPGALAEVNRALRAREIIELEPAADGVRVGHRHVGDPIDDALARLAEPIVREIASGRRDRVRVCANESCRWVFYDASPTGRRRWCDMATCGNRAKAARHRARQRASEAAISPKRAIRIS